MDIPTDCSKLQDGADDDAINAITLKRSFMRLPGRVSFVPMVFTPASPRPPDGMHLGLPFAIGGVQFRAFIPEFWR